MPQTDDAIGDVSERQELRRRLGCHSFAWYMMTVMPEKYLPADQVAHGRVSAGSAAGFQLWLPIHRLSLESNPPIAAVHFSLSILALI